MAATPDLDLDPGDPEPPERVAANPILYDQVWSTMHLEDDNWMGALVGETGSGKSWAGLRLCEVIDPDFTVDQVAFSVVEFLRLVNDDSLGRGSMILFEEASVELASLDFQSTENRFVRQVLDTWRHQNRGAVFTLPAFGGLDSGARGRMSALIQMWRKNKEQGFTVAKYKRLQQDSDSGKIYRKYPVIDGLKHKLLKFQKPSRDLREAYEQKKAEYTSELNTEMLEELLTQMEENQEDDGLKEPKAIAEVIHEEDRLDEFISSNHGQLYIDRSLIEVEFGIGRRRSKTVKSLLQRDAPDDLM
jgi:hypothetical protein